MRPNGTLHRGACLVWNHLNGREVSCGKMASPLMKSTCGMKARPTMKRPVGTEGKRFHCPPRPRRNADFPPSIRDACADTIFEERRSLRTCADIIFEKKRPLRTCADAIFEQKRPLRTSPSAVFEEKCPLRTLPSAVFGKKCPLQMQPKNNLPLLCSFLKET